MNIVEGRVPRYADDPFSWGVSGQYSVFPCAMDRHAVEFYPEHFRGAALTGRHEQVLEALLADGAVEDPDTARSLRNDLIHAHRAHLPQLA
ncbi:MAG: hypothetical protein M3O26_21095 [Pseudomonadota bacterium]|nr:hypothetical protein [Pseudomonadota bacterium]